MNRSGSGVRDCCGGVGSCSKPWCEGGGVNWNSSWREVTGGVKSMLGNHAGTFQDEILTGGFGSYIEVFHVGSNGVKPWVVGRRWLS